MGADVSVFKKEFLDECAAGFHVSDIFVEIDGVIFDFIDIIHIKTFIFMVSYHKVSHLSEAFFVCFIKLDDHIDSTGAFKGFCKFFEVVGGHDADDSGFTGEAIEYVKD